MAPCHLLDTKKEGAIEEPNCWIGQKLRSTIHPRNRSSEDTRSQGRARRENPELLDLTRSRGRSDKVHMLSFQGTGCILTTYKPWPFLLHSALVLFFSIILNLDLLISTKVLFFAGETKVQFADKATILQKVCHTPNVEEQGKPGRKVHEF